MEVEEVGTEGVGRVPLELMLMAELLMLTAALLARRPLRPDALALIGALPCAAFALRPCAGVALRPCAGVALIPVALVLRPDALVLRLAALELRLVRLVLRLVKLVLSPPLLELRDGRVLAGGSPVVRGGKRSKRSDVALIDVISADLRRRGPEMRRRRRLFHAASLLASMYILRSRSSISIAGSKKHNKIIKRK